MALHDTRYHAIDNLRALMMWLGIVIHVTMNHVVMPTQIPWRDDRLSPLADALVGFIHAYRMPVFFIIAGFLAAMLLERRRARAFLRHRLQRLALPFAIFWPFIWVATGLAGLAFVNRMVLGRWGLDESVVAAGVPRGPSTMHMWFLWMLAWFSVATALLAAAPPALHRLLARVGDGLARLGRAWWGFAVLAVPLVIAGLAYPKGLLMARGTFWLPWNEWLHNGLFYGFGLAAWHHRATLLPHWQRHWRRYAWAGLFAFLAVGAADRRAAPDLVISAAYNACTWLWSFAWIGLALQVLDRRTTWGAWLADSAYWVYLVHLPLTVLFGCLLYGEPLPIGVKILINITATTALCLLTYKLFVRHTWVGVLLNGVRHPRGGTPPAAAAAA